MTTRLLFFSTGQLAKNSDKSKCQHRKYNNVYNIKRLYHASYCYVIAMHASYCCYNTIAIVKQLLNILYRGMKSDWLDTELNSYMTESDPSVAIIRLFVTLRDRTDR